MADIVIRDLAKAFDGKPVLKGVSAVFPEGKISAVMGPSGAGKTTLLRLMMGLETPDGGTIGGVEGRRLAAVFQENRLLERLTPVENLRLVSPGLTRERAVAALNEMGLTDCADQPVSELSGGMKRRVALLRALLSDGEILILDEPFRELDAATRDLAVRETLRLRAGRTVVIVTHDPDEAEMLGAAVYRIGE